MPATTACFHGSATAYAFTKPFFLFRPLRFDCTRSPSPLFAPSLPLSLLCPLDPMHQAGQALLFQRRRIYLSIDDRPGSFRTAWFPRGSNSSYRFYWFSRNGILFFPLLSSLFSRISRVENFAAIVIFVAGNVRRVGLFFLFGFLLSCGEWLPLAKYLVRSSEFRSEELRSGHLFGCRYIREMRDLRTIRLIELLKGNSS